MALDFFNDWEHRVYASQLQRTKQFAAAATEQHHHPYWDGRALDATAHQQTEDDFRRDPAVQRAFDAFRTAPRLKLAMSSPALFEQRPVIRGHEIVLEPALPGGIRYVANVDLLTLAHIAPHHAQVPELFEAYCRTCPPVPLPSVVGGYHCSSQGESFMNACRLGLLSTAVVFALIAPAAAQEAGKPAAQDAGIPVTNDVVKAKCGGCHKSDDKGRMSRISYRRATPENWERTIKRMVSLNHATLDPADARVILKYLADRQGLAPDEERPIAFEAERRMVDFTYAADKDTADLCQSCHSISRVLSERRTKEEWELLVAMHRGLYPLVDNQPMVPGGGFRRTRAPQTEPGADGRPPDNRHPMDKAIEHLTKALPLETSEWAAWSAAMQPPKLAGRWAIVGTQPGKGPVYGQLTITGDPAAPDSFNTETKYTVRPDRRNGDPYRQVAGLHRLSVARPRSGVGRGDVAVARSAVRRARLEDDVGTLVHGRLRRNRRRCQVSAAGQRSSGIRYQCCGAQNRVDWIVVKIFGANLPTDVKAEDIGAGLGVR